MEGARPRATVRAPLNIRLRGRVLSLTPVLGALGTFVAWLSVVALHVEARTVGIGWMVVGLVGYAIYRRRSGLDLRTPAKIERGARPPDFTELAYRSAGEAARLAGRVRGVRVRTGLVRTRNPARAILDEARRLNVEVIHLSTVHAPASERPFGPITAQHLAERPVRIVVQTGGPAAPAQRPRRPVAVPA